MNYHVDVTAEPPGFYEEAAQGFLGFAVHVAPAPDDPDAVLARAAIEEFLAAAPRLRFLLVEIDLATGQGIGQVTLLEPKALDPLDQGIAAEQLDLMGWLDERAGTSAAFWNTGGLDQDVTLTGNGKDIEPQIKASQLLRASLNWPAPLPQRAGLVHFVLTPPGAADLTRTFVIVPQIGDVVPTSAEVQAASDPDRDLLVKYGGHQFHTARLAEYDRPPRFQDNGWITPDASDSATARLMGRLRAALPDALLPLGPVMDSCTPDMLDNDESLSEWVQEAGRILILDQIELVLRAPPDAGTPTDPIRSGRIWDTLRDAWEDAITGETVTLKREYDWLAALPALNEEELAKLLDEPATTDINTLTARLADETELEKLLVRVLDLALSIGATGKDWMHAIDPASATLEARATVAAKARANFVAYYELDGADARGDLRLDQAGVLMRAILAEVKAAPAGTAMLDALAAVLTASRWPAIRLGLAAVVPDPPPVTPLPPVPQALTDLLGAIAPIPACPSPQEKITKLATALYGAHVGMTKRLLSEDFVPDTSPQPLPIAVASSFDSESTDTIMRQTTGVGVVITAQGMEPAHANIAALLEPLGDAPATFCPAAIETSTLSENYGQADIFLRYDGLPQIGRQVALANLDPLPNLLLPYRLDHSAYPNDLNKPPQLAYGRAYGAVAYFVPNSGRLPPDVRAPGGVLLPGNPVNVPNDPTTDIYLRTTRVSETTVADGGPEPRLARIPQGVTPIAPALHAAKYGDGPTPPVLLVGHNSGNVTWRAPHDATATLALSLPRVGFEDFDRWVANPVLRARVAQNSLLTATIDPHVTTVAFARDWFEASRDSARAARINRLPDPAVAGLKVELTVFDRLFCDDQPWTRSVVIPSTPWKGVPSDADSPDDIVAFLNKIDAGCAAKLEIKATANPRAVAIDRVSRTVTIQVREGDICLLTVRPLVNASHFAPGDPLRALHEGLQPDGVPEPIDVSALPVAGSYFAMPGVQVLVEAMQLPDSGQHLTGAQRAAVKVRPEGLDRGYGYDLLPEFVPGERPLSQAIFRAFSEVDVMRQRWRPTGRPIYHWIDPVTLEQPNGPVVVVTSTDTIGVPEFEADAFHGRPRSDGERKRVTLPVFSPQVAGATAIAHRLDSVTWPAATATYFRHSEVFRSRYLGALIKGIGTLPATDNHDFTHRIALLADTTSGHVAPPQVRHILPALSRPDAQATGPLPFVCTLSEKPFEQFGLADRIVAGVETIHRYTLDSGTLELEAFRKETGPEPRDTRVGIDDDVSRNAHIRVEGPVGQHFEEPSVLSPGFVNSSYLLHLAGIPDEVARGQVFAKVNLGRYPAPSWTFNRKRADADPLPQGWWLGVDDNDLPDGTSLAISHAAVNVVTLTRLGDGVTVAIKRANAYPEGGQGPVELCKIDLKMHRMALIHQSRGNGHHAISILQQSRKLETGEIDQPQLLAAIRYQADGPPDLPAAARGRIVPVMSSETTVGLWGRSALDMARLAVNGESAELSDLNAKILNGKLEFADRNGAIALSSFQSLAEWPVGRHVHLAVITLKPSESLGGQIDLPDRVALLSPIGTAEGLGSDPVSKVALLAIETNATPLDDEGVATLDLKAHRSDKNGSSRLMLRCRVVPETLAGVHNLEIRLTPDSTGSQEAVLKLRQVDCNALRHIDILLDQKLVASPVVRLWGASAPIPLPPERIEFSGSPGGIETPTTLSILFNVAAGFSADISLFPAMLADTEPHWNWDWIFPPVSGGSDPDRATSAIELSAQAEAVAVPLGVSKPITCT